MISERLKTARRAVVRHARAANRRGFAAHEQALTEILLTRAAPPARVRVFNQREEGSTGADWLWWWHDGGEWFGALVQAKKNKPIKGLPRYDFEYKSGGSKVRQLDLLLSKAAQWSVPAMYVLYNHPPIGRSADLGEECCVSRESWATRLGVAFVPALAVAYLVTMGEDLIVKHERPLECLMCGGQPVHLPPPRVLSGTPSAQALHQLLTSTSAPMPRTVARSLLLKLVEIRRGHFEMATGARSGRRTEVDRVFPDIPADQGHFAEPYFDHVLRGLRRSPPGYVAQVLNGAPASQLEGDFAGIRGVVIFDETRGDA